MKQLIVVDDHEIIYKGVIMIYDAKSKQFQIDYAKSFEQFVALTKKKRYDLVLLDIYMPDVDTVNAIDYIINILKSRVIIYSMAEESIFLKRYLNLGIHGYVNKEAPWQELDHAIQKVLNGGRYLSERGLEIILSKSNVSLSEQNILQILTNREFEVFKQLANGRTLVQIARNSNTHISTVSTHKHRIFKKLKLQNLFELIEFANKMNVL